MTRGTDAPVKRVGKRKVYNKDPLAHKGEGPGARSRRTQTACERCKVVHRKCSGHKRKVRPYKPCMRDPIPGGAVCYLHGGKIPEVAKRAQLRVAFAEQEGAVASLLKECDLPAQHPIDGLLEVVRHSGAMMRLLGALVGGLDLDPGEIHVSHNKKTGDAVKWTVGDTGIFGYDHTGDQNQHVLMAMYGQWSDRYARACKLALDANIDERLVRNAEQTSSMMYQVVVRAIQAADLDPEQAQKFTQTLAGELRKIVSPFSTQQMAGKSIEGKVASG